MVETIESTLAAKCVHVSGIVPTSEKYGDYTRATDAIDRLFDIIASDTAFSSSTDAITEHWAFAHLMAMGDRIVPYIIHTMTHKGCRWLHLILLSRLVPSAKIPKCHAGMYYMQIADWLRWYCESEFYDKDDIYHGLVDRDELENVD